MMWAVMFAQFSLWWKIVLCVGNEGAIIWSVQWWYCVDPSLCDDYAWYKMNHSLNSCPLIKYYNFSVNFQWVLWMPVSKKKCIYVEALPWAKGIFLTVGSQEYTPYWQITPPSDQNVKLILFCSVMYSIPETCYLPSHYASSSYVSACCSHIRHTNPFAMFACVTWCVGTYCWSHKQHYIFQSICCSPRECGHCVKFNITIVFMKVDGHHFIFGLGACTYGC